MRRSLLRCQLLQQDLPHPADLVLKPHRNAKLAIGTDVVAAIILLLGVEQLDAFHCCPHHLHSHLSAHSSAVEMVSVVVDRFQIRLLV